MSKKQTATTLDLYCGLMEEIKLRVNSINTILKSKIVPPFPGVIAREHCFVQLRMICEIVAIGCVIVHNQTSAINAFEKLWNANDIMNRLNALNPYSFPRAVNIIRHPPGSLFAFDIIPTAMPALTKENFLKLYGRCGDGLHRGHLRKITANIPAKPVNLKEISDMLQSVVDLLRAHAISSADYNNHYICVMENTPGGPCAIITSVSDPSAPPQPPAS